ncbi:MAG: phosphoribosyltransferase [Chitinispirillaceae bacterium]|nr:phosphoribosyltransferase [Chitinispirillaceae bacterium]
MQILPPSPLRISGRCFEGYALSHHLDRFTARSGASITRRSELAETMYRYRYQGDGSLLPEIAGRFSAAIETLFPTATTEAFDGLFMVPPPIARSDHGPVVALATEIARRARIPSFQGMVRDIRTGRPYVEKRSDRGFDFASPVASTAFAGKRILVIDDIYRSGRSLDRICSLVKKEGMAATVMAIVGTLAGKINAASPYSTS